MTTLISPPDTPKASSFRLPPRAPRRFSDKIPTLFLRRRRFSHDGISYSDIVLPFTTATVYGPPDVDSCADSRAADAEKARLICLEAQIASLTSDLEVLKNELDNVSTGLTRQLNLTNFDLGILSSSTKKLRKLGSVVNELSAFAHRCKQCIDHHAAHVARQMSMMHHDLHRDQDRAVHELGKRHELQLEELERRNVERLNAMERRMEERVQAVERRLEEDNKAQLHEMERDFERRLQSMRDSSATTQSATVAQSLPGSEANDTTI